MNADGVLRIISGNHGPVEAVTLRRTGSPDVNTPAAVLIGGASITIGEIQEMADKIIVTDRLLKAAGWIDPPHHGDMVVYSDGRVTVVQGRAETYQMEADRVFVLRCMGGG